MTLPRPRKPLLLKLLAPLIAFAATLVLVAAINRSSSPPATTGGGDAGATAGVARSTDEQVQTLQAALKADPKNTNAYASLGNAYLQKVRETGDSGYYVRAQEVFGTALHQDSGNAGALAGMGTLALARHDFEGALRYGRKAHSLAPDVVRILGVIVDAEVELGRYQEAGRTLQQMVDLEPNLASYARVSYFRELHGDLAGATRAMRLAVSAGGDARENLAYVQTLLGNLEFDRGHIRSAAGAYRLALARYPGYVPAGAGLAKVEAAHGELGVAIRRYRGVVARLPLPEYVIALGEAELAAGRPRAARRDLELVSVEERLLRRNGVDTDTELALYEANHGDTSRAVALARRSWEAAPSVRSADALGWSLTRSGRPAAGLRWATRALRLGSRDHLFLYHAGMSALAANRGAPARRYLEGALAGNARFSPLYGPQAQKALEGLR